MAMKDELPRKDGNFDRQFWRGRARHDLQQAFRALEGGRIPFGGWQRLFLSAAIDHFHHRHFKRSARSAQRIFNERQQKPFPGRFTQEKSLANLRAEYEGLARRK
jgi:hypothetical protein